MFGVFDARCLGADDGAVNTAAWLRQRDCDKPSARVKIARALRDRAPLTAAALGRGDLSYEKAAVIAAAVPRHLAEVFARSEAAIVEAAAQVTIRDTVKLMKAWRDIADDDRCAIAARARTRVLASHTAAQRARELEAYVSEAAARDRSPRLETSASRSA